jgi:hypothetical protein
MPRFASLRNYAREALSFDGAELGVTQRDLGDEALKLRLTKLPVRQRDVNRLAIRTH